MQKLQDCVFSVLKTTSLSPAVFDYLQPSEDNSDKTPLGGILKDTKHGWLALGHKFCVIDLRTGLKIAQWTFDGINSCSSVTSVVELPTPLTKNSQQLIISLETNEDTGLICIFHINGSQLLRSIQSEVVITKLAVSDNIPDGPFTCFEGLLIAGTKAGEVLVIDLCRSVLLRVLQDISQGNEQDVELQPADLSFLPLSAISHIKEQRDQAVENYEHIGILLNSNSIYDGQFLFHNPDGSIRMKAKKDHVWVSNLQYIHQLGSVTVGYNFGAFQIWNLMNLSLEFTSQVNVECLPVTHFGFQEPCDDPRAFCYLWVVYSATDRLDEEAFPLAVMYSLTYQGKRMLSDTQHLYQEFLLSNIRFQIELSYPELRRALVGGRCVSCHTYSLNSSAGDDGEDSMLNLCQLVWECWGDREEADSEYCMLLFDLDQWYKDQMPAKYQLQSNTFMSVSKWAMANNGDVTGRALDVSLCGESLTPYCHATPLDQHFHPSSLQYNCICLNTSEVLTVRTVGIQRQIIACMVEVGPSILLEPNLLHTACLKAGLTPLYETVHSVYSREQQRRFLLSVALEARLSPFLKRAAHAWASGSHAPQGCTLPFMVDWCWKRAIDLKQNAKDLTAPLFTSSSLPDRNLIRCLEQCVRQLTQLTSLLDDILTKCCNLIVPDVLSEYEEKHKCVSAVWLYVQVIQWFLSVGLLPERQDRLAYPGTALQHHYSKRRIKLHRLSDSSKVIQDEVASRTSCSLLYVDQLIEHEFGGERLQEMWRKGGSENNGLYPPPTLYSLLRLYLVPDIPHEHKHSLVLYLLVDYSMIYDDIRYESVIRKLMQFPTMFGLSNTAIKATQAFWHLDHRDFDFALDQLQCLTGNTLSEWQHSVVLSALLAQNKTQRALQYLHVRKPPPIQKDTSFDGKHTSRMDRDKLDDWQTCCNLYLARGLVVQALDVVRMSVKNARSFEEKVHILDYFFKGCRYGGHLAKVIEITLSPFEEEMFIKYLENCNETQTSDILVMYYIQQARYIEAQQYNNKLKLNRTRQKEIVGSVDSLASCSVERDTTRDMLIDVICASLPSITAKVVDCTVKDLDTEPQVFQPKPMSVFVQAKSPKNTFTYKSSFIHDTIENASEIWANRPKMRRGIKRALDIENTPFLCTPKLNRSRSIYNANEDMRNPDAHTPPKRPKLDLNISSRTPQFASAVKISDKLSKEIETLLEMPEILTPPQWKLQSGAERSREATPHSILKIRKSDISREAPSPVDSRYLSDSDDEMLDNVSQHSRFSESKQLRFTIPTASESGSTPSPTHINITIGNERNRASAMALEESTASTSYVSAIRHSSNENQAISQMDRDDSKLRKTLKDSVRGRRSHSTSLNSSLGENINSSIESIADIPITLINPRYSSEKRRSITPTKDENSMDSESVEMKTATITPQARRPLRAVESTPSMSRSRSVTPERIDSPIATPIFRRRRNRSRSRTPEVSPRTSALEAIIEQPIEDPPSPSTSHLYVPKVVRTASRSRTPERRVLESPRLDAIVESPAKQEAGIESPQRNKRSRSRSKTPERLEKGVTETPGLEIIPESPSNADDAPLSPKRSLRSRSRTPELDVVRSKAESPRSLRSRSKTPDKTKLLSPIEKPSAAKAKKSLTRMVLEHNTFKKTISEKLETSEKSEPVIECTPLKNPTSKGAELMEVMLSPITDQSMLPMDADTPRENDPKTDQSKAQNRTNPALPFTTLSESYFDKSVLGSYDSSATEDSEPAKETKPEESQKESRTVPLLAFTTLNESYFEKSVLKSYESSVADDSNKSIEVENIEIATVSKTEVAISPLVNYSVDCRSVLKDVSSLMTSDSDIELKDSSKVNEESHQSQVVEKTSECKEAKDLEASESEAKESLKPGPIPEKLKEDQPGTVNIQAETQALELKASDIQKEKQVIVEIEREIHEIEVDISGDESHSSDRSASGDRDGDESGAESSGDAGSDEDISVAESEASDGEDDKQKDDDDVDVISIEDSSNESHNLQIDETYVEETNAPPESMEEEYDRKDTNLSEVNIEENDPYQPETKVQNPLETDPLFSSEDAAGPTKTEVKQTQPITDEDKVENPLASESVMPVSVSMLTDDNSVLESDHSDINLNYSDENCDKEKLINEEPKLEIAITVESLDTETKENLDSDVIDIGIDVVDAGSKVTQHIAEADKLEENMETAENVEESIAAAETSVARETSKKGEEPLETEAAKETLAAKTTVNKPTKDKSEDEKSKKTSPVKEKKVKTPSRKRSTSSNSSKSNVESTVSSKTETESSNIDTKPEVEKSQTSKSRKRTGKASEKSQSDHKPTQSQSELDISTQPKPNTRKLTKSSNKSETDITRITPEKLQTPTKSRSKTPEMRRILTRRASKELSDSRVLEDSILNESDLTPKKRATRARSNSQSIDDNISVVSESSVRSTRSTRSKASALSEDGDGKVVKKARKSIVAAKPDLSVIPEMSTDEGFSKMEENSQIVHEYSTSRRLTRHQKSLLESWLDVKQSPKVTKPSTSRADSIDDDTSSVTRGDYEGSLDSEEQRASPESMSSSASRPRTSRLKRAASEAKVTPKAAARLRKGSVDVLGSTSLDLIPESPSRSRRSSFNKALEALHTPKGKRGDTPSREEEGRAESPSGTPARRARRAASTHSTTSGHSTGATQRSKRTAE